MTRRVTRLDELAQSTPPPRDLWPAIAEAIEADKMSARAESAPRRSRWMPAVGMAAAVVAITGVATLGRLSSSLIFRASSKPSMPGMRMSISTRSYCLDSRKYSASGPLVASW